MLHTVIHNIYKNRRLKTEKRNKIEKTTEKSLSKPEDFYKLPESRLSMSEVLLWEAMP